MNDGKRAWIFDVDGVLSNLEARTVVEPSLLSSLAKILLQGDLLACNTGRDTEWVHRQILEPLEAMGVPPTLLKDVFLSCEKGGTWQEGDKELELNEHFALPPDLVQKIHTLISQEFSESMFFDEAKRTMISIEMRKDVSIDFFLGRQKELHPLLITYLKDAGIYHNYIIQEDLIATDIIHKNAGKDVGMEHILTWIETLGHTVAHFYCFGDNPSDTHMGDLLTQHRLPFTFIYVGTKSLPTLPFVPLITAEKFDKGTAEALRSFL